MQVLDMILDVLAYIWYGIKRIFKNPVLRDAAIILLSVLVSVLVINARTKSINEQAEKRIAAIEQRYQPLFGDGRLDILALFRIDPVIFERCHLKPLHLLPLLGAGPAF